SKDDLLLDIISMKELNEIKIEHLTIDLMEELRDIEGAQVIMNSFNDNANKLILVIGDNSCGSCVDISLNLLRKLVPDYDHKQIKVLGYYENRREFYLLSKRYNFEFYFLSEKSSLIEAAIKGPVFFILDSNNTIKSAFFPDSRYPILTEKYLTEILNNNLEN
ncbi:MAG: hypothetical protein ACM3Q2_15090, partial [Syntrophothermus sp.]